MEAENTSRLPSPKEALLCGLVVLGFFSVLEVGVRIVEIWVPPQRVDYGQGFDAESRLFSETKDDPRYLATHPRKRAAFRYQRILAAKPESALRIAVLGGSSVYNLQPEFNVLRRRLAEALSPDIQSVGIINAGGRAYGSQRLVLLGFELVDYQPDLLIIYSGHNEFEEVEQLALTDLRWLRLNRLLERSALIRFLRDRLTQYRVARLRSEHNQRVLQAEIPNYARAWKHPFTQEDVEQRMNAFRANLGNIIRIFQARGVPVILATVPSNLYKPYLPKAAWERYREVWQHFEAGDFATGRELGRRILRETPGRHQSSDLENAIIRDLAEEFDVPLADVEVAVTGAEPGKVPGQTLFDDHCHLSERGNELWRKVLEPVILELLQARRQ